MPNQVNIWIFILKALQCVFACMHKNKTQLIRLWLNFRFMISTLRQSSMQYSYCTLHDKEKPQKLETFTRLPIKMLHRHCPTLSSRVFFFFHYQLLEWNFIFISLDYCCSMVHFVCAKIQQSTFNGMNWPNAKCQKVNDDGRLRANSITTIHDSFPYVNCWQNFIDVRNTTRSIKLNAKTHRLE